MPFELNRARKLTDQQREAIRYRVLVKGELRYHLSKEYGVAYMTIDRAVNPEKHHQWDKQRWEKTKGDPVELEKMKIRHRYNMRYAREVVPAIRKYYNKQNDIYRVTPAGIKSVQKFEMSLSRRIYRKMYNDYRSAKKKNPNLTWEQYKNEYRESNTNIYP